MITLRILKLLEQEGHGTVDINGTINNSGLFFEKLPQGKTGVAIYSRGAEIGQGKRYIQAFDLYSRGIDDVAGYQVLEQIIETLMDSYTVCSLPKITGIDEENYTNISIVPISSIENSGQDDNDRVLYSITAQITYNKSI